MVYDVLLGAAFLSRFLKWVEEFTGGRGEEGERVGAGRICGDGERFLAGRVQLRGRGRLDSDLGKQGWHVSEGHGSRGQRP